jgi:exonuclease SbcD
VEPVKLLHTSDWHLGRTLHGESLLEHQSAFLDWLLQTAVERGVDGLLVAGDVYDRAVPPVDAVRLLDRNLAALSAARIPTIVTSGNHDSAIRLGFGSALSEHAGIHLRTAVSDLDRPVLLRDDDGPVAVYGIPYLLPDAVMAELGAQRSHTAVLQAATDRIRVDALSRGVARTVVISHSFTTGGIDSESERDIRVGGIGDTSASVFDGFSYVALGHLHGQQVVRIGDSTTVARYSGSPLAFSFSERFQPKSVTLVDIDSTGHASVELLATPVPRKLREVRGTILDLLARAEGDLSDLADAWVKVVLTDRQRPQAPMERLRAVWPHTLVLGFEPEGGLLDAALDLARLAQMTDPVQICSSFVEFVANVEPTPSQRVVLRDVTEHVQRAEVGG